MTSLITPETMAAHRATWFVWAGGQKMRREATMRGTWGYDVTCSCGWESRTGGATRRSVEDMLWDHRYDAQSDTRLHAEARADGVDPEDLPAYVAWLREKVSEPAARLSP